MLWLIVIILLIFALAGGFAVNSWLFLLLIVVVIVALAGGFA